MVIDENTQLLTLTKSNLPNVTDQTTLDILRYQCSSNERLYKSMIEKLQKMSPMELEKQQIVLLKNYGLSFPQIEEQFNKHTKNGVINTSEALTHQDQNLKSFNLKVGQQQITYKKKGEVDQVGNKKVAILAGTNRLATRQNKGFTASEQLQLMNLHNLAKSRRDGILETPGPLKDLSFSDLSKFKNNMLNAVRNEDEIDLFENEPIVIKKKHFAEKKFAHSYESEEALLDKNDQLKEEEQNVKKLSSTESDSSESNDDWNVMIEKSEDKKEQKSNLQEVIQNKPKGNAKSRNINSTKLKLLEEV